MDKPVIDVVDVGGVMLKCIFNVNGAYTIGIGNESSVVDEQKQENMVIPEILRVNGSIFVLNRIADRAFQKSSFVNVTFPSTTKDNFITLGSHCFSNCMNLENVKLGSAKIRVIPPYAFAHCSKLTSITCGITNEVISEYAFFRCGLQMLILRSHFAFVGMFAFAETEISDVDMKDSSLRVLPESLFENCHNLSNITLPKQLNSIHGRCFYMTNISKLIIPKALSDIGNYCFWGVTSLTSIDMRNTSLRIISNNAFEKCINLATVYLSKHIITIGDNAFADTAMNEFEAENPALELGQGFLSDCRNLTKVDLSNIKIIMIPNYAFHRCVNLCTFIPPIGMSVLGQYSFSYTAIENFTFKELSEINYASFMHCTKLKQVSLAHLEIGIIPSYAFAECESLTIVQWPTITLSIEKYAFYQSGLVKLEFDAPVSEIGDSAFSDCALLQFVNLSYYKGTMLPTCLFQKTGSLDIVWPQGDNFVLGTSCFASSRITKLELPNNCNGLMKNCFFQCKELHTVDLSKSQITSISPHAFEATGEISIKFPPSLKVIQREAFQSSLIREIDLINVRSLEEKVFMGCTNLRTVKFVGSPIKKVLSDTFTDCFNLENILWSESLGSLYHRSFMKTGLKALVFPSNIITLYPGCFNSCMKLQSVNMLMSSITEIPTDAFSNCKSLEIFTLPKEISFISKTAFDQDPSLKIIIYPGNHTNGASLNVPNVTIIVTAIYRWKTFAGIPVVYQHINEHGVSDDSIVINTGSDSSMISKTSIIITLAIVIFIAFCALLIVICNKSDEDGTAGVEMDGELPCYQRFAKKLRNLCWRNRTIRNIPTA